jgi:Raf kinase inhibitor-like YbhB/YbcL family protein
MRIESNAFTDGDRIPDRYTGDGEDVSPPLSIADLPAGTRSLALVVDDPDAPAGTWVHWLVWRIPADLTSLPEGVPTEEMLEELGGARQGKNDFDRIGYGGPAPPPGHGQHHYRFTAYAMREHIDLDAGATRDALDARLDDATLETARLTGTYSRD